MKIEVYFNLHKNMFSIRALEGKQRGRVIAHMERVGIRNAEFVVQKAGREKVLAEKKKNVHAFIRGDFDVESIERIEWDAETVNAFPHLFGRVTYNPYRAGCFQQKYGINAPYCYRRIDSAGFVFCFLDGNESPHIIFQKSKGAEGPEFKYGEIDREAA